ncbi:CHAT domain-containing protein [uncultured Lacinutrix sp.]|uniref:CHAT domain-containing protein n=1 Tax=uncultured Lacinutrix sp. TaxID=574032 RepID=UPI00262A5F6F|nr:CHAT domain-containing protein [uncultured Lacinutrix sp.]
MVKRFFFIIIITLFNSNVYSQDTSPVLKIIKSDKSKIEKQNLLETFFTSGIDTLNSVEQGNCYHNYATHWFHKAKDYTNAIKYIKKAIELKKTNKDSLPQVYNKSLYNLGRFEQISGNHFEAIKVFEALIKTKLLDKYTVKAYSAISYSFNVIGDFNKAINYSNEIERKVIKNSLKLKELRLVYLEKVRALGHLGRNKHRKDIVFYLNKVDSILKEKPKKKVETHSKQFRANLFIRTKQYKAALPLLNFIIEQERYLPIAYNNIAVAHDEMGDNEKAIHHYEKAIKGGYLLAYQGLGDLYVKTKKFENATITYNKGILHAFNYNEKYLNNWLPSNKDLEFITEKIDVLYILNAKAMGLIDYYNFSNNKHHLQEALKTFQLADKLVDLIRSESTEYQSKLYWREIGSDLYLNAVKVCKYLNNPEMAFYFIEKNKALLLLEDVTNEQAKINSNLPIAVAKKEFELKRGIYLAQEQFLEAKDTTKAYKITLEDAIFEKKRHFEKFIDSIAILYPKYAASKKNIKLSTSKAIRQILKTNNQVLLQYILGENEGYLVYGAHEKMMLFPITNVPKLQGNIIQLLKQLQAPLQTQTELSTFKAYAGNVFNTLIPEEIQDELKGKHIIIVPDQVLQKLPFEALVNKKNDHYFIEDSQISYAYSMSHLQALNTVQYDTKKELLAFAPVDFSDKSLPKLPLSAIELQNIEAQYSGNIFTHNKASKTAFLEHVKDHNILHLSTHAELGDNGNPWIAFADSKMTLNEIYATKMNSDMVVLSACQTGLGEVKKGEGVMSLARGFFSAGTKSVVSSLWSVNDKSNEVLMSNFYKFLSQGDNKATALHKAKLNYLNTHDGVEKSPHFWAPLVLVGDTSAIAKDSYMFLWVLVAVLILVLIYFITKKRLK